MPASCLRNGRRADGMRSANENPECMSRAAMCHFTFFRCNEQGEETHRLRAMPKSGMNRLTRRTGFPCGRLGLRGNDKSSKCALSFPCRRELRDAQMAACSHMTIPLFSYLQTPFILSDILGSASTIPCAGPASRHIRIKLQSTSRIRQEASQTSDSLPISHANPVYQNR